MKKSHLLSGILISLLVLFPIMAGATRLLVWTNNNLTGARDVECGIEFLLEGDEATVAHSGYDDDTHHNLESYVIPDTIYNADGREWIVTRLGGNAFFSCPKLKSVSLPKTLRQIDAGAFGFCLSLEELYIPAGVHKITAPIFVSNNGDGTDYEGKTQKIRKLSVDQDNEVYYSESNCILEKSSRKLIQGCSSSVIPDYVTTIGQSAFSHTWMGDEHLNIPESVVCIEDWAFSDFHTTTGFDFPSHIQELGLGIFAFAQFLYFSGIQDFIVPEGITKLLGTFLFAPDTHSITLPSTLSEIDAFSFYENGDSWRYLVCYAKTPPAVIPNDEVFWEGVYKVEEKDILNNDDYYPGIFLLVPRESIEQYKLAPYWRQFPLICAIEDGVEAALALGIEQVIQPKSKGTIYDLNGVRLSQPRKGINIQNGKKVIIK